MSTAPATTQHKFDSDLPRLLDEAVKGSDSGWALRMPMILTKRILRELAEYAIEHDDPQLHIFMLRLGLYEVTASERVERIEELKAQMAKQKEMAAKAAADLAKRAVLDGWDRQKGMTDDG